MRGVVCPWCRGALREAPDSWGCIGCGRVFRVLRGIPDLRTGEDVFLPNEDDWAFARRLDAAFDRLDFRGLLERYFELSPEIPDDLRRRQIAHILEGGARLASWIARPGDGAGSRGPVLDLGTGTGSFLAAIGRGPVEACGVDIAMRWLLVARKRLDEAGLGHVRLVCAGAERLPFADGTFAAVVAGDVIEHVVDQAVTLAEAHRVLVPGGRLVLATPNRYSLAPEPHVGLWGVGFLPRRWMPAYVRWGRGLDFRAIRTLGYLEWRRLLRRSPFGGGRITVPGLGPEDTGHPRRLRRLLAQLYNRIVATRPGRFLALGFGPLFQIVCERSAGRRTGQPAEPLAEAPGRDDQGQVRCCRQQGEPVSRLRPDAAAESRELDGPDRRRGRQQRGPLPERRR